MKHNKCFYILFLGLLVGITKPLDLMTCKREIVESYGITSYTRPAKEKLIFCPNIRVTCCPAYEQFKVFKDYNERLKPNFTAANDLIVTLLTLLKKEIKNFLDTSGIGERIRSLPESAFSAKMSSALDDVLDQNIEQILDKALLYQKRAANYISSLKSSFFCTICDYSNQLFIDTEKKTITFGDESCDALAVNTILYTNILNNLLVPYLEKFTYLIAQFGTIKKYQKLHNFGKIKSATRACAEEYKKSDSRLSECRAYCSLFRFNTDNYAFEGYPELFANTLVEIRNYKTSRRILSETKISSFTKRAKKSKADFSIFQTSKMPKKSHHSERILESSVPSNKVHKEAHVLQKVLEERFLQGINYTSEPNYDDELDSVVRSKRSLDLFDPASTDEEFDDKMVVDMMEVQDAYNSGNGENMKKIVKRFLVENYRADIDDLDDPRIFPTGSDIIVQLHKFKTVFGFVGIDSGSIVSQVNWSLQEKEIAISLSGGTTTQNDVLDPEALNAINLIGNNDVENFYKDNFLNFDKIAASVSVKDVLRQARFKKYKDKIQGQIIEETTIYNYLTNKMMTSDAESVWDDIQIKKENLRYIMFKEFLMSLPVGITIDQVQGIYNFTYYNITEVDKTMLADYYTRRNDEWLKQLQKDPANAGLTYIPLDLSQMELPVPPTGGNFIEVKESEDEPAKDSATKSRKRKLRASQKNKSHHNKRSERLRSHKKAKYARKRHGTF